MLTINKTPAGLTFAGNQVKYLVTSPNFVSVTGINSVFNFRLNGKDMNNGHTFKLNFAGKDLVFTLSNRADDDPLRVDPATGPDSFSTWALTLYLAFIDNYDLASNYTISLQDAQHIYRDIRFIAKVADPKYDITLTAQTTTGITTGPVTAGRLPVYRSNFGILLRLMDDAQNLIGEDFKTVDKLGQVNFDIAEYLRSSLSLLEDGSPIRFAFPENTGTNFNIYRNYLVPFMAMFAEKYDGMISKMQADQVRHAIGGGLNRETIVSYNAQNLQFFDVAAVKNAFMTHCPTTKLTGKTTPEKLFFLFQDDKVNTTVMMRVMVTYTDNSTTTYANVTPFINLQPWTVYEFMVGYAHLNIAGMNVHKTPAAWEVCLLDNTGSWISEIRHFDVDLKYRELERTFIFRNSFSAYDVVRFLGVRESTIENDPVIQNRINGDADFTARNYPVIKTSADERQTFKINSGWVNAAMKNYFRDFLLSPEVYEIVGDDLLPTVVTTKKTALLKDKEGLIFFECECERAYTDKYFSNPFKAGKWKDSGTFLDSGSWSDSQ